MNGISCAEAAWRVAELLRKKGWQQKKPYGPEGEICLGRAIFEVATTVAGVEDPGLLCDHDISKLLGGLPWRVAHKIEELAGYKVFESHAGVPCIFAPDTTYPNLPVGVIPYWNDRPERTEGDVQEMLRAVEKDAELEVTSAGGN